MDSLCALGQAAEAETTLPELRCLQTQAGNGLNLIRLRWLEGKIAAGRGRIGHAGGEALVVAAQIEASEFLPGLARQPGVDHIGAGAPLPRFVTTADINGDETGVAVPQ